MAAYRRVYDNVTCRLTATLIRTEMQMCRQMSGCILQERKQNTELKRISRTGTSQLGE